MRSLCELLVIDGAAVDFAAAGGERVGGATSTAVIAAGAVLPARRQ